MPTRAVLLALIACGCVDRPAPADGEAPVTVVAEAPATPEWCPTQGEVWTGGDGWKDWLSADLNHDGTPDRVVADGPPGGVPRQVRVLVVCAGVERVALQAEADGARIEATQHAGFAALALLSRDPEGRPATLRYLFSPLQGAYVPARKAAAELGCPAAGLRIVRIEPVSDDAIALQGVEHLVRWTGKLDDGPRSDWILVTADPEHGSTHRAVVACDDGQGAVVYEGGKPGPTALPAESGWRPLAVDAYEARFDPQAGIYR